MMPRMQRRWSVSLLLGLLGAAPAGAVTPLVMMVDTSAVMPEARSEGEQVFEGLHRDLGEAFARRLGRPVRMKAVPRKRIAQELEAGRADLVCDYQPAWLPGPFQWSHAFVPDQTLLVTPARRAAPPRLEALAGERIGTVLGYAYPEVAATLGAGFVRDDAPDAIANLRKLELGRIGHALTGKRLLDYRRRAGGFTLALHPPLVVAEVLGQCALSPHSDVGLAALNTAINGLVVEGELTRILARYR